MTQGRARRRSFSTRHSNKSLTVSHHNMLRRTATSQLASLLVLVTGPCWEMLCTPLQSVSLLPFCCFLLQTLLPGDPHTSLNHHDLSKLESQTSQPLQHT